MALLQIEHEISDLAVWREAFDRFASAREKAGVTRSFQSAEAATDFRTFLINQIWSSPDASPALMGLPTARVLTELEP